MNKWTTTKLGAMAKITMGHSPASAHYNSNSIGLPLIQGNADVSNRKTIIRTWTSEITNKCNANDIVMSVRAPAGTIARATYESCIGRGVCAIKSNNDYLYHYLVFRENEWTKKSAGSTFDSVTGTEVKSFPVSHPESELEQRRIASILTDLDNLISAQEALIAKKTEIKQATMALLLTGKKRLPGFAGEWTKKTFGELFTVHGNYAASRDELGNEGHAYLHYGDIHVSSCNYVSLPLNLASIPKLDRPLKNIKSDAFLQHGDVVFVDASEDEKGTSKHYVVANPEGIRYIAGLHTITCRSKSNELALPFKRFCFQTEEIQRQFKFYAVGTKVMGVNKVSIKKITIFFPSLDEQTAIAEILLSLEDDLLSLNGILTKLKESKQAVMSKLLTGEIRVPDLGITDAQAS